MVCKAVEQSARYLLADMPRAGEAIDSQIFEIIDIRGAILDRVAFRSVIRFR